MVLVGSYFEMNVLVTVRGSRPMWPNEGGFLIDGVAQFQALFDGVGTHVKQLGHVLRYLGVGHVDIGGSAGVDIEAYGLCHTDGIGNLDESFASHAGGNEILGDVTGRIGCRAVDLGGSLPEKAPPPWAPRPP